MRRLSALIVIGLTGASCAHHQEAERPAPSATIANASAQESQTTSPIPELDPTFSHLDVDPLLDALESNSHLIFDFTARFPKELRQDRASCSIATAVSALGVGRLNELGVNADSGDVPIEELTTDEADQLTRGLTSCPSTAPMLRALLQSTTHSSVFRCVESEISPDDRTSDLLIEIGSGVEFLDSRIVSDLADTCGAEHLENYRNPFGGTDGKNREDAANAVLALAQLPEAPTNYESRCRTHQIDRDLPKEWFDRLLEADAGNITTKSVIAYLRSETTDEEVSDIEYAIQRTVFVCGAYIAALNYEFGLSLSIDQLRCLGSQTAGNHLDDLYWRNASAAEARSAISDLLPRCGEPEAT